MSRVQCEGSLLSDWGPYYAMIAAGVPAQGLPWADILHLCPLRNARLTANIILQIICVAEVC